MVRFNDYAQVFVNIAHNTCSTHGIFWLVFFFFLILSRFRIFLKAWNVFNCLSIIYLFLVHRFIYCEHQACITVKLQTFFVLCVLWDDRYWQATDQWGGASYALKLLAWGLARGLGLNHQLHILSSMNWGLLPKLLAWLEYCWQKRYLREHIGWNRKIWGWNPI